MKWKKKFYEIKIWFPKSGTIKKKFVTKPVIVVGSDASADIKFAGLNPFHARLDLQEGRIHWIEDGSSEEVEPGYPVFVEGYAFQWAEIDLFSKCPSKKTAWVIAAGLLFIGLCIWIMPESKKSVVCPAGVDAMLSDQWSSLDEDGAQGDFKMLRKSYLDAVSNNEFLKARIDLDELGMRIHALNADPDCRADLIVAKLEEKLVRKQVSRFLKEKNVVAAAEEFSRFSQKWNLSRLGTLQKRLIREARNSYLEAYRLEDQDAEKSMELQEQAEQICLALRLEPACYHASRK